MFNRQTSSSIADSSTEGAGSGKYNVQLSVVGSVHDTCHYCFAVSVLHNWIHIWTRVGVSSTTSSEQWKRRADLQILLANKRK